MDESGDVEKFTASTDTLGREQPRKRKTPESKPAAPAAADEPAPQENGNDFMNGPTPDVQKPAEPEDIPEGKEQALRPVPHARANMPEGFF